MHLQRVHICVTGNMQRAESQAGWVKAELSWVYNSNSFTPSLPQRLRLQDMWPPVVDSWWVSACIEHLVKQGPEGMMFGCLFRHEIICSANTLKLQAMAKLVALTGTRNLQYGR